MSLNNGGADNTINSNTFSASSAALVDGSIAWTITLGLQFFCEWFITPLLLFFASFKLMKLSTLPIDKPRIYKLVIYVIYPLLAVVMLLCFLGVQIVLMVRSTALTSSASASSSKNLQVNRQVLIEMGYLFVIFHTVLQIVIGFAAMIASYYGFQHRKSIFEMPSAWDRMQFKLVRFAFKKNNLKIYHNFVKLIWKLLGFFLLFLLLFLLLTTIKTVMTLFILAVVHIMFIVANILTLICGDNQCGAPSMLYGPVRGLILTICFTLLSLLSCIAVKWSRDESHKRSSALLKSSSEATTSTSSSGYNGNAYYQS